jgi:putative hydrolase of the HAD superfamily
VIGTSAVFFDVDFTLIRPGPRFQGVGYHESCLNHGVEVDIARFDAAVAAASSVLDSADQLYDADLYVRYTARIIELMGGTGPAVSLVARELYGQWAEDRHFHLYDDVTATLEELADRRVRVGLISNSHRRLESFQENFGLHGLIEVAVSSSDLGFMKPHPAIFRAALERMGVAAAEAVMVGDSLLHDVEGARRVGMVGVWLARDGGGSTEIPGVPVISTLRELPGLMG